MNNRQLHGRVGELEWLTRLSGPSVRDSQGVEIGRVSDFIVDLTEARLAYVSIVLTASDGADDSGPATVPWTLVSVDRGANGGLRVGVRRETLLRIASVSASP